MQERQLETWDQYVAAYHALYVNSTLASVDQSEASAVAELETASSAVGKSIDYETALKKIAAKNLPGL